METTKVSSELVPYRLRTGKPLLVWSAQVVVGFVVLRRMARAASGDPTPLRLEGQAPRILGPARAPD